MKNYLLRISPLLILLALAGAANAVHDIAGNIAWWNLSSLDQLEGAFWGAQDETWINKWARNELGEVLPGVERFWGSSTVFVWTTDIWHASKSLMLLALQIAVLAYRRPNKWWMYATDLIGLKLAFSSGWHLTKNILM